MSALGGIEDFLLAIILGFVVYVFLSLYQAANIQGVMSQVLVLAVLIVLGGIGVKLFLRIYSLLYEEEQG